MSDGGKWNLDRIAAAFTGAALDPARWTEAMEVAAEETGSYGSALFPIHGRSPQIPFTASLGESFEAYLNGGWVHRDERYRVAAKIERDGVATDLDYIDDEAIARHPYYQEFLAPAGLKWFAGVKVAAGDDFMSLSIQRSKAEGMFETSEIGKLAQLSARLGTAVALAQAVGYARMEAANEAFEVSGRAVFMLNRSAEVVLANAAARKLIGDGIEISAKRLLPSDKNAQHALDRTLHLLLWMRTVSTLMPPVVLPRRDGRPLLAYCARLEKISVDMLSPCQAIVVLVDPDQKKSLSRETVMAAFGLTSAEARVAIEVAAGREPGVIAADFGNSIGTVRAHLKTIFQKTGVTRQPELVHLLSGLL